jgi:hypothetical protein
MSLQDQVGKNSLSLKTLGLLHRYLDDFVLVGKARRGEFSPVELETLLRKAAMDAEEVRQILTEYKRFRNQRSSSLSKR